jgi:hypothetical protein
MYLVYNMDYNLKGKVYSYIRPKEIYNKYLEHYHNFQYINSIKICYVFDLIKSFTK